MTPLEFFRFMLDIPADVVVNVEHKNFDKGDKAVAYCMQEDEREFTLTISNKIVKHKDETYYLESLAHELKHVQQYVSGRLVDGPLNIVFWEGATFICWDENYFDQPWEIEAFAAQYDLTLEYLAYREAN